MLFALAAAPRRRSLPALLAAFIAAVMALTSLVATPLPVLAQESGLPLPRFVTTRSTPINVRVGPGTRYEIAWVYLKSGVPVEIIQEFDTWRKVRDVDGDEGWIHQNLLSGDRAAYVAPWDGAAQVPLKVNRNPDSSTRAVLASGLRVGVSECDGVWCAVSATQRPESGSTRHFSGFVEQGSLWGVYGSESFD
jgi:SH3-like domain-containing protein